MSLCLAANASQADDGDGLGQTIQIYTHFTSFVGKPSWLLIIRDVDHGQNIPYLFDVKKGDNVWIAFTYSRNYLITVSNLQIETYQSRCNKYKLFKTNNFCGMESQGRIVHGESMSLIINGDLSPNRDRYSCNLSTYPDGHFTVVKQDPS